MAVALSYASYFPTISAGSRAVLFGEGTIADAEAMRTLQLGVVLQYLRTPWANIEGESGIDCEVAQLNWRDLMPPSRDGTPPPLPRGHSRSFPLPCDANAIDMPVIVDACGAVTCRVSFTPV